MSKLFESIKIKDIEFKNRIVMSPMCQYMASSGQSNSWHQVHYGSRAIGGAGLIIQEATAVSPEGRISPGDLGLYSDEQISGLAEITTFVREHGSVAGIQLAHAGRKAACAKAWDGGKQLSIEDGGWQTVAPSAVPFFPDDNPPVSLDDEGIAKVISDFRSAARRAHKAGFQLIEIHAAHGYLLHQFLSPLSNHRTDQYGGNFENRARLLLEVVASIREVWPDHLPLFVRISATDWAEGGWDVEEAVKLSALLKDAGVDLIDASSGGLIPTARIPLGPGYQVPFAEKIRKEAGIMTGAVGMITEPLQAEEILQKGQADFIIIGREFLRNPHFPLMAAAALNEDIEWPRQYGRARK
ncbi:MAG: NADPH dehydrogenase NamA [Bacteroidales bacterium]|nr:NADPH dehydrogenase NamA [Bacteroidales bacterium]